jgi:hypothetical protein
LGEEVLVARMQGSEDEHHLDNEKIAKEDKERELMWPSNLPWISCSPSLSSWVALKRARRVVNVLEIDDGQKLSSSNWSISKPLS